jgi:hypothetical protein
MDSNYQWYQKIDASFFDFYEKLRTNLNTIFNPYKAASKDLTVAAKTLTSKDLTPDSYEFLGNLISSFNDSLLQTSDGYGNMMLMQYNHVVMSPDQLTPHASFFKQEIMMPMMSLFSFLTMPDPMTMSPISDVCVNKVMPKFVPTYEPYAKKIQDAPKQVIAEMPKIFANATVQSKLAVAEVTTLIARIRKCAPLTAISPIKKQKCVDDIVSFVIYVVSTSFMKNFKFISTE